MPSNIIAANNKSVMSRGLQKCRTRNRTGRLWRKPRTVRDRQTPIGMSHNTPRTAHQIEARIEKTARRNGGTWNIRRRKTPNATMVGHAIRHGGMWVLGLRGGRRGGREDVCDERGAGGARVRSSGIHRRRPRRPGPR